jgi:mRNA interferase HigB|tara:strand:+ start:1133 stop:1432 length:300 start_codon:yes stop_codon:yes gene_type:complete
MRVISRQTLKDFYSRKGNATAKAPCEAWFAEAKAAVWQSPQDVKARYPGASILAGNRVVFDLGGNKYRLIVAIHYNTKIVYIRFIGTHADYDKIDAEKV